MNPALFTNSNFYLSLPSVNLNLDSPLSFSDVFGVKQEYGQNVTYINTDAILASLDSRNDLNFGVDVGLLGFGFKTKNGFFTFSTTLRTIGLLEVPKGVFHFLGEGNVDENGRGKDVSLLDNELLALQSYLEYGIGYGYHLNDKLTIGLRFKLLQGLVNISTMNTVFDLQTSPDLSSLDFNLAYNLRIQGPIALSKAGDTTLNYKILSSVPQNWGMAFDFGAKYQLTDKLSLAASVLDIGSIHWVENITELHTKDGTGSFRFAGAEWDEMFSNGVYNEDFFSTLTDSVTNELAQYDIDTLASDYWERVPWKFNLAATYEFNKVFSASLMYRGEKNKFNYFQSVTAGVNINLWNWLEVMACNSVNNFNDWLNPGVGVSVSLLKMIQVYTLFDYVSDVYLVNGKSFRFFFGMNISLGNNREHDKD